MTMFSPVVSLMPNGVRNNGLTFILSQTWTPHYLPSWITDEAVVSVTQHFPCRNFLKCTITPTLLREIQVLLLTTALPVLIKCIYNVSSLINSLRK